MERIGYPKVCFLLFLSVLGTYITSLNGVSAKDLGGDAIVSGTIAQPRTLIPFLASDSASASVADFIFNGLIKYDKDLNIVGDLAEKWEVSSDGKEITFFLRKGVFWHDGKEFTADDVLFTYEKLIDPNVPTPYSGDFKKVAQLKVINKYTVKVTYQEPFSPGLVSWSMAIVPRHLLEKEDLVRTEFARKPVGTGPYRFEKWIPYEKVQLSAYQQYFEHRPFIDRIVFRIIPDDATLYLELLTEGVDTISLTPLQYQRQTSTQRFQKSFRKFKYPSNSYIYMAYNLSNPLFNDIRVRTAVAHAVNVGELIDIVFLSEAQACTGPYTPLSWGFNEQVKPLPYDVAQARTLLKDAGWEDTDKDGYLEKGKEKFEFTLITNQGNTQRQNVAEIIQQRLKEVGIRVKIKVVEWSVFVEEVINKKKFDAVLLGWSLSYDPDLFDIWHSSKTKEGEFNFIGYQNKEVDRLLEEGRRVFDQEKRKALYHQVHQLIYQDQPYFFICVPDSLTALHTRFQGVVPAKRGYWYNFIDWWVPKEKQKYRRTVLTQ